MKKPHINTLTIVLSILLFCSCQKQNNGSSENTWKSLADMPTPRFNFGFVESGGLLYAIGGYNASGLNKVEVYDPASDSWQTKANMPTARGYLVVVSISGKIYAIGGITGSDLNNITYTNVTEEYDPATDQWAEKSPFPISAAYNSVIGNQFIAGSAINGKIYVAAGASEGQPTFIYDPATDTWETDNTIAIGKFNWHPYFAAGSNNDMFVSNGDDFLKFSSADKSWFTLQSFSTQRLGASLASDGRNIYSIGGYFEKATADSLSNEVGVYSISAASWTKTRSLINKRHSAGAATFNGNLYVAGGSTIQSNYQNIPLSSMEVLSVK